MILTFDPTETKMVGKVEEEEVARCQVVSTADINTREEACEPARYIFHLKVILSMIIAIMYFSQGIPQIQNFPKHVKQNAKR